MIGPSGAQQPRAGDGIPAGEKATGASKARLRMAWPMVVLVVILVFILQNLQSVKVTFFTADWRMPLGISLLLAAVLGGFMVFGAGSLRLLQQRRAAKRRRPQNDPPTDRSTGG